MTSRSSKKTSYSSLAGAADDAVEVGRIRRAHGIRGEVAVEPYSDVPERFAPEAVVEARGSAPPRRLTIETVRRHRGELLVHFAGVADRDEAEVLRGAVLVVPRAAVPEPPAETWYYFQLVGCRCTDAREGDLGEVVDLVEDGGGILLEVRDRERTLLVPFVRALVRRVDTEARQIELDLPEGFLEACASRS